MNHPRVRTAWNTYQLHHGPNMTPMVDVVMVILIFFMATASVLGPEWYLKSSIPRTAPASATPATPDKTEQIRLTLRTLDNTTRITAQASTGPELADATMPQALEFLRQQRLGKDPKTMVVLITPGPDVPYQDLVTLHEACERLGVLKVGIQDAPKAP